MIHCPHGYSYANLEDGTDTCHGCEKLEQTQDVGHVVNIFGGTLAAGVFRVVRDDETPDCITLQRAPELSEGLK